MTAMICRWLFGLSLALSLAVPLPAHAKPEHPKAEHPKVKTGAPKGKASASTRSALANRMSTPRPEDIDRRISLQTLLNRPSADAFSSNQAASIEGHVLRCQKEADGDMLLTLAASPREPFSRRWVIIEVTSGWQKRKRVFAPEHLEHLIGRRVRAVGWLYYEPEANSGVRRGTRWELHPVTEITPLIP